MAAKTSSVAAALLLLSLFGAAWAGRSNLDESIPEGQEIGKAISATEPWIHKLRRLLGSSGGSPSFGSSGNYMPYGGGSPTGYYGNPGSGRPTATADSRAIGQNGYNGGTQATPVRSGSGGGCRRGDISQQGIIDCTNAMRANPSMSRCGAGMRPVGPLRTDPRLMQAAQGHSVAQDRARRMAHTLGGSTMSSRIRASGYQGRAYAENVAAGQRDSFAVVEAWMCSSGHRKNMMSCNYGDIGVGVSCSTGRCYWTQNFGCSGSCTCQGGGSSAPLPGGGVTVPSGSGSGGYPSGYPSGGSGSKGYPSGYPSGGYGSGGYPSGYPSGGSGSRGYPSGYHSGGSSGGSGGYPGYGTGFPSHSTSRPSSGGSGSGFPGYFPGGSSSGSPYSSGGRPSGGSGGYPWSFSTPNDLSGNGFQIPGAGSGSGGFGYPSMPKMPSSTKPSMPSAGDGFYGPSSARSVVTAGMGKVTTEAEASGYGRADGKGDWNEGSASAYATAYSMG